MIERVMYRGRQFFGALRPRVDQQVLSEANQVLTDGERALFESMTSRDQQHCLGVYRRLRDQGHGDRDLLVAALLHDVGKGQVNVWQRSAFVVLEAAAPTLLRRLVHPGDSKSWRQALYRCLHHAELGAALARKAGSSPDVVSLIRGDQTHDARLAALQAADDTV
jgi:hypothetical protein